MKCYRLGECEDAIPGEPAGWGYPFWLDFYPGEIEKRFVLVEGRGVVQSGGEFSASDLLNGEFRPLLEKMHLTWILPFLVRAAAGEFAGADALEVALLAEELQRAGREARNDDRIGRQPGDNGTSQSQPYWGKSVL